MMPSFELQLLSITYSALLLIFRGTITATKFVIGKAEKLKLKSVIKRVIKRTISEGRQS